MINKNIEISIITLTKNNHLKFQRTFKSIQEQEYKFRIEWLVIDGSNLKEQKNNEILLFNYINSEKNNNKIFLRHINSFKLNIYGIYPCMNYGKNISKGKFIIFLNSGDQFYNSNSLNNLFVNTKNIDSNKSLIFGQANIIASQNLDWYYPGKKMRNFKRWLNLFEPNHQSMLISNELAKKYNFESNYNFIADGYWKRKILNNASDIVYIKYPICKFFLDGISATKPSKKIFISFITNSNINLIRKLIFTIKFIFPKKLFSLYHLLQKYKSLTFDILL